MQNSVLQFHFLHFMSSITHVAQGNLMEPHKTVSSLQRVLTLLNDHRGSRSFARVWMAPPSLPVSSCLLLLIALHHLLVQPCLQSKRREQAPDFLGKGRGVFVGVRGREGIVWSDGRGLLPWIYVLNLLANLLSEYISHWVSLCCFRL